MLICEECGVVVDQDNLFPDALPGIVAVEIIACHGDGDHAVKIGRAPVE